MENFNIKKILFIFIATSSLVGYPLIAILSNLFNFQSPILSLTLRLLIVFGCIIFLYKYNNISLHFNYIKLFFYIFFIIYVIRILFDAYISENQMSYDGHYYIIWFIGASVLPFIVLSNNNSYSNYDYLFKYIYIVTLIITIYLAFSSTQNFYDPESNIIVHTDRLQLYKLNPITIGIIGFSIVILSFYKIMFIKSKYNFIEVLPIFLGLYVGIESSSRGPLISFLFVLFLFFLKKIKYFIYFLCCVLFIYIFFPLENIYNFNIFSRIYGLYDGTEQSSVLRKASLLGAINQFLNNPLFGDALEENISHFYPHNSIIEAYMATGIFFGSIYFLLNISLFIKSIFLIKNNHNLSWIALLWIFNFFESIFSGSICFGYEFWVLSALLLSIGLRQKRFPD